MTVRDLYDAALIEINKLEAPSMLLEDYNYFINKAIQQYINKAYNRYEINQQATDDLGALKVSTTLTVENDDIPSFPGEEVSYFATLPSNYWHMLSCIVSFEKLAGSDKCGSKTDSTISTVARKMTSDIAPTIINNAYFKPSYKNPYYSISVEQNVETDLDRIIDPCDLIENGKGTKINLMVGKVKYEPTTVFVNYLKTPEKVYLEEEDLYGDDRTKEMEFSDYICYEIINEFVKLLLENTADPRLSTNVPINQSIIGEISAE
ncbi:MAG: hypothetical protein UD961_02225 [Bacteroidales bacterium]|nr:hypothetical protein [Bacteroidales bacterium]